MDYIYRFPVVKGFQAEKEYYIAMVPLKMLARLFPSDDEEYVLPEYRAQRKLNMARIPVISKYILENRDSYVFSALAASIDGQFRYLSNDTNSDTGLLEVSMDAKFLINDGQHRKSAILEALKEDPSLGEETISIVLFADKGLTRSQQIFTDLNKNAVKTSNSISELYDSRDEMAVITRNVIWNIDFLNTYTDKEKDILGKYSSSLFTLNTFYTANKCIVGRSYESDTEKFLLEYWTIVVENMRQWQELRHKEITKVDLRQNYIATQSIVIQALGRVGNYFYLNRDLKADEYLKKIDSINWSRNARQWYMRAISKNGRIITNKKAALLIANVIKKEMDIPLSREETDAEEACKKILDK
ncbi:MAG: DNA sulfur modification protein DndB [Lachnospira sp.]|nr:DNA sulfur modification protein DndB [Lachnospira sp.]